MKLDELQTGLSILRQHRHDYSFHKPLNPSLDYVIIEVKIFSYLRYDEEEILLKNNWQKTEPSNGEKDEKDLEAIWKFYVKVR